MSLLHQACVRGTSIEDMAECLGLLLAFWTGGVDVRVSGSLDGDFSWQKVESSLDGEPVVSKGHE